MSTLNITKKPAQQPTLQDWSKAKTKAALEEAGWTLRQLSIAHGYSPTAIKNALHTAWPRAEAIIAAAIGVAPQVIWPTRYRADGTPRSGRNERGIGRRRPYKATPPSLVKSITASVPHHVELAKGN